MSATITSAAIDGLEARIVTVEADIHHGLPKVTIVGLPDAAVQEARERIRSAIKNAGFKFPHHHISLNLSPADWRKAGSGFDVPAALAVLVASKQIPPPPNDWLVVGELSLSGELRPITGSLSIGKLAQQLQRPLVLPTSNAREAALLPTLTVLPARTLGEITQAVEGKDRLHAQARTPIPDHAKRTWGSWPSIIGQFQARRAMTIAAAGHHNALLIGPPGSGKSLLAKSTAEILPALSDAEMLEVTSIHSVAGLVPNDIGLVHVRPFRQPHHTASVASLVGGGRIPKPGELSLAHHGILFLDEFPEFSRNHIEALRQPLENGTVVVSRVAGSVQFPAGGMLIAAMNPCPCGFLHDPDRTCRCSPFDLRRYHRRLSGPVLDRFDLFIQVPRVPAKDLTQLSGNEDDPRPKVARVRKRRTANRRVNESMLEEDAKAMLRQALEKMSLSLRAYHRTLRVAQTIALIEAAERISIQHVAEALQYRPPNILGQG